MNQANKTLSFRILLSRLLTHSGDQAWDFVVPLVLLRFLPGQLRIAALYYLLITIGKVVAFPRLSQLIDRMTRPSAVNLGLGMQAIAIPVGGISLLTMADSFYLSFVGLVVSGLTAAMGASFMSVLLVNDLIPSAFSNNELTVVNSRLRQMDLITEVTIPVIAGTILLIDIQAIPHFGFLVIALWNLISFVAEYALLKNVFALRADLAHEKSHVPSAAKTSMWSKVSTGWRGFFKEPAAASMVAYALICLTVLSPHGVMITGFLKDGWKLSEFEIGVFRGIGAAFGMLATFIYTGMVGRWGLLKATQMLLCSQAAFVLGSVYFFFLAGIAGPLGFMACIVLSRVGLYGFSLGEVQIRQVAIAPAVRGQVNGFANALASLSTLLIYGGGSLLASTDDFKYLVVASAVAVMSAAIVFTLWVRRSPQIA